MKTHISSRLPKPEMLPEAARPSTRARLRREYLTPERLQWLALLEREGPSEWETLACRDVCIACNFLGWTQRRRTSEGLILAGKNRGVLHELSPEGREVLTLHRETQGADLLAAR